ncbi:MAG: hypothetical protein AAB656_02845 [Patescibacteria group bacterium]
MDIRKRIKKLPVWMIISVVPILFLIFGTWTLPDYGVNWDEPFHFMRGQAYLHFFLSGGKRDYHSLPPYPRINSNCFGNITTACLNSPAGPTDRIDYAGKNLVYEDEIKLLYPKDSSIWRSYYQHDTYTFDEVIKTENGHPAIGDIVAAFFNFVFYQKLHILGDVESYHFFQVFTSFLIVLGVSVIVFFEFGIFPSIVSSFLLGAYPLFFSESHFNIKDPPETAFFGLTIILFYLGITKNSWIYIIISSIIAAFALGTKFNAFFIAPILALWLIFYVFHFISKDKKILSLINIRKITPLIISLIAYPFMTTAVFYFLWPYLWSDPIGNFLNIVKFYQQIGVGTPPEMANYIFHGWNMYPIVWILYTSPIPILVLSIVGFVASFFLAFFKRNSFAFLAMIWLVIPILRASFPNSSIYGGVRQIMEFVPAFAILSGIGTYVLINQLRYRKVLILLILSSLVFVFYEMVKIHPNQNVYFNQLIGGLSGAKEKKVPYWGNSYGNAYQQGLDWLTENAEPNAKLGLPISTMGNIPRIKLRSDIEFSNGYWSGPNKKGEYEIELDFDWGPKSWYSYAYYDTFLNPVYETKVDNVSILKIWKNDPEYVKPGFEEEKAFPLFSLNLDKGVLTIDLGKEIYLTRVTINHSAIGCNEQKGGYIAISKDGRIWEREPEPIDYPQVPPAAVGIDKNTFVFLFAAKKARYVLLDTMLQNSCTLNNYFVKVMGLKRLP